ncbi:Plasmodium exported protein, unknown function [Plasmodium vivax]|uniref:VIR protein n=1 Tax=Plasmodium vivax TaxID=5855 RepID=A0A565A4X6_PLAVI|nr:Plasmodium exported protein, unknown function [Plasmodium vivax]
MQYQQDVLLNKSNNRLLAMHETIKDFKYAHLSDKLSDDVNNMNLKYIMNNTSTYDQLNKKKLNDLDAYKKGYKKRYSKKKGLEKLDCYCERKLFDKIDEIYELSRTFGIIFPALFFKNGPFSNWCVSECSEGTGDDHTHTRGGSTTFYRSKFSRAEWNSIYYFNVIFSLTLCIIVLTAIIYALVKVVKYERLKAGKGKIKGKVYYNFCKNVFT